MLRPLFCTYNAIMKRIVSEVLRSIGHRGRLIPAITLRCEPEHFGYNSLIGIGAAVTR
jgi:hypothetical protein